MPVFPISANSQTHIATFQTNMKKDLSLSCHGGTTISASSSNCLNAPCHAPSRVRWAQSDITCAWYLTFHMRRHHRGWNTSPSLAHMWTAWKIAIWWVDNLIHNMVFNNCVSCEGISLYPSLALFIAPPLAAATTAATAAPQATSFSRLTLFIDANAVKSESNCWRCCRSFNDTSVLPDLNASLGQLYWLQLSLKSRSQTNCGD